MDFNDGKFHYFIRIGWEDGETEVIVADRGQQECSSIYQDVVAGLGTVEDEEILPDGDCQPVHESAHVGQ